MADSARFQCAVASSERAEPLGATASQVRSWLLVEVRGSWGRNALVDSDLGLVTRPAWREQMRHEGTRVLAIRRDLDLCAGPEIRLIRVVSGRPGETTSRAWVRDIDRLDDVEEATTRLPGTDPDDVPFGWIPDDGPFVLVCTNGRHDPCCATFGRPLARALRESTWAPLVWECSHVGGDRFAGNVVILPEGLYFGRCDPASAEQVLAAHADGRLDLANLRGRSTYRLPEQAVEHFVRGELGADRLDAIVGLRRIAEGHYRVAVRDGGVAIDLLAVIERRSVLVPSPLTCHGAEGHSAPAFDLVSLSRLHA